MASKVACSSNINKQNPFRYEISLTEFKEYIYPLPFCYRDQLITGSKIKETIYLTISEFLQNYMANLNQTLQ